MRTRPHVAVVGGGVSGLTAAYRLTRAGATVTVLEATPRLGGKIAVSPVAGVPVDAGAESVLARRPEAMRLIGELGLDDRLAYPADVGSRIYSRGALRDFPPGQVMGVPGDLLALARSGTLSPGGVLRATRDLVWPAGAVDGDVSVADHIGSRMGPEVVDRLVEPLLGGVYAGRADRLSLRATLPQLAAEIRTGRSLTAAVRAARAQRSTSEGPVFATLRGGLGHLVEVLAARSGATIRTSTTVRALRRTGQAWRLTLGSAHDPRDLEADGVVLACPATPASRLLEHEAPTASRALAGIDHASMAVVTLAYPASAFPHPPGISGFLVPAVEGRAIKAVTFSSVKWPWLAEELRATHPDTEMVLLRCSLGRIGQEALLRRGDEELVALAHADLADICGVAGTPVDQRVTRWGGGLPQYAVGHEERVAEARADLAAHPALAVCGAAYNGVGIAACVAGAEEAAEDIAARTTGTTSPTRQGSLK